MRKRQILLLLIAIWLARIIPVMAQEEMPVIVDPPQVILMPVFTNWQEIQLIYTIRWLDGYKLQLDDAKPENMAFGLELDPVKGYKLEQRNQRKYKKENYIDLIYYLRYINEKKGEMIIPEQEFGYIKEEAGKSEEGSEVHKVKAPGITLRYDSVLTKNADDIIDRVDFGSFKRQENLFNGLIGGMALVFGTVIFLLFRKSVIIAAKKTGKSKIASAGGETYMREERLVPKKALRRFNNILSRLLIYIKTEPNPAKVREVVGHLYNELRRLLLAYNSDLLDSDTAEQIKVRILKMEPAGRLKNLLSLLSLTLCNYDDILYKRQETRILNLESHINSLVREANELRPIRIFWFNLLEKKQKLVAWFTKLLRGAK